MWDLIMKAKAVERNIHARKLVTCSLHSEMYQLVQMGAEKLVATKQDLSDMDNYKVRVNVSWWKVTACSGPGAY